MAQTDLVEVAVCLPLYTTFTYRLPSTYAGRALIGMRVLVPFGKRNTTGYIVGFTAEESHRHIKEVHDLLDEEPLWGENDLKFYRWISQYYFHPLGLTIKDALPQGINTEYKKIISLLPKGKEQLKEDAPSLQERAILQTLAELGEVPLKKMEKRVGSHNFYQQIYRLKQKGCIQLSYLKARSAAQPKKEKWIYLQAADAGKTLTNRQEEIYTFIQKQGRVSMKVLKNIFGNCASTIVALANKGLLLVEKKEVYRRPRPEEEVFTEPLHTITEEQDVLLQTIRRETADRGFFPFLLHGVTGSGKTEIYLRVMEDSIKKGRQCLLLVPEISLTSQLWDRVSSRLKVPIAMLHSSLSTAERFDAWRMIKRGEIKVTIGARSAIFAAFAELGAIIVDEEHDSSYKQDDKLRYSARDLALIKGKIAKAVVILGSATPSLESYSNVLKHKYSGGSLNRRIENRLLPQVKIIDMKIEKHVSKKHPGILSRYLQEAIEQRLRSNQQCLLFLNRRGFAPVLLCQQCGHTFRCPNCEVALIHHQQQKRLRCHYCDLSIPLPETCPACRGFFLIPLGWGTERLEAELKRLFPQARIARMDRDTASGRGAIRNMLKDLYQDKLDLLIGTQMIVKGHHLPNVTLVGVVCADHSLNFPDYRAGERTFQLLTQVAGRAGRGEIPGEVYIQTYNPNHYSILCAQRHDYHQFYAKEIKYRQELGYPPCSKMINFRLESTSKSKIMAQSRELGKVSRKLLSQLRLTEVVDILGPASAPWGKIKGKYRHQMLLKSAKIQSLRMLASRILQHTQKSFKGSGVKVTVDVDPLFIL